MLEKAKSLNGYKLVALDGEIGSVAEFYFDDRIWTVRYLVADTGNWLTERLVLISPLSVISIDREARTISLGQTRKQIEDGPSLEAHKTVSRQFEESYNSHYGWPSYWDGTFAWGTYLKVAQAHNQLDSDRKAETAWEHSLLDTKEVTGYQLEAEDGEIGHVEDFILDEASWTIQYLVVDTRSWWPGKHVLVSPRWIGQIDWADQKVSVLMTREDVRNSPEYTEASLLSRDYEEKLHGHYKRVGYWDKDLAGVKHTF